MACFDFIIERLIFVDDSLREIYSRSSSVIFASVINILEKLNNEFMEPDDIDFIKYMYDLLKQRDKLQSKFPIAHVCAFITGVLLFWLISPRSDKYNVIFTFILCVLGSIIWIILYAVRISSMGRMLDLFMFFSYDNILENRMEYFGTLFNMRLFLRNDKLWNIAVYSAKIFERDN